ncbi:MAG: hypothetical protein FWF02_07310 [Micrococcales bacterium]|nr:hypothetical protein [Micrococcales bacterium]MCL2667500.1 hypothetical protein [Micrococcales bacterium]
MIVPMTPHPEPHDASAEAEATTPVRGTPIVPPDPGDDMSPRGLELSPEEMEANVWGVVDEEEDTKPRHLLGLELTPVREFVGLFAAGILVGAVFIWLVFR